MTKKKTYRRAFKILNDAIKANIIVEDAFITSFMAKLILPNTTLTTLAPTPKRRTQPTSATQLFITQKSTC